jgi:hypothetical protein
VLKREVGAQEMEDGAEKMEKRGEWMPIYKRLVYSRL